MVTKLGNDHQLLIEKLLKYESKMAELGDWNNSLKAALETNSKEAQKIDSTAALIEAEAKLATPNEKLTEEEKEKSILKQKN